MLEWFVGGKETFVDLQIGMANWRVHIHPKREGNSKSQRDNCTVGSSQLHSHCQAGENDGRVNEEICAQWKTQPWQEGNPAPMQHGGALC